MTVGESKPSERRCSGSLPTPPKPEFSNGDVIADRFKITSLIGQGTYGDVYLAIDLKSTLRDHIAIKIDRRNVNNEFLASEARILQDLLRIECVPKFILHGNVSQGSDSRLFLAMKRHGESLSSVRKKFKDGVPIRICSAIFVGMVNALEKFHNAGYIHRDIKPSNFLFSTTVCSEVSFAGIIMIDFGLSFKYLDEDGGFVYPTDDKTWKGTTRYASLAVHEQKAISRADDIVSLMFVLLEFIGKLFWIKMTDREVVHKKKVLFLERIDFKNIPLPIIAIFNHLKNLKYEDKPNYRLIRDNLVHLDSLEFTYFDEDSNSSVRSNQKSKKRGDDDVYSEKTTKYPRVG